MAFVLVSSSMVYIHSRQEKPLSGLALENVEALASGESGGRSGCCPSMNHYCISSDGVMLFDHRPCQY